MPTGAERDDESGVPTDRFAVPTEAIDTRPLRPDERTNTDQLPVSDGLPRPPMTERRPSAPNWNRITVWEVVGYTAVIVFIAALALGVFDIMLPWTGR